MAAGERSTRSTSRRVNSDGPSGLKRLSGRRVLVVGGSGFIGRHVCRAALEAGAEVTATHHRPLRDDARVEGVAYRVLDVFSEDVEQVSRHETAIWCVGRSDHREAWVDPSGDLSANTLALARFLERFEGRLVLVSSGAVYHGLRGPVTPTTPLSPLHPYAVSKLAAERLALSYSSAGRLANLVVLRLFHPFGPGERPTRLVPQLLTRFVSQGESRFTLRGDGRTLMDVQPVASVAMAIASAAAVETDGLVLDVCRGGGKRVIDVVYEVAAALEVEPEIGTETSQVDETIEFEPDPGPARAVLDLPPDDDLRPAVRAYAERFRPEHLAEAIARSQRPAPVASGDGALPSPEPIEVSLIVPCLNEDQNVGGLVDKLVRLMKEAALRTEILIVDDCSDDYTFREALMLSLRYPEVVALHKGLPRGIGNAIRFGLDHARGRTGVIVMGDNVDPLAAIPDFHRLVSQKGYDLVLLNRHANPEHRKSIPLWPYRVYQWIFRMLCRIGTGLPHRDPTYAYRGFSIDFLRSLELESGGFEISPEITLKAWLRGARIGELTGAQGRRVSGASNFVFSQQALRFFRVLTKATLARRFGWARRIGVGRSSSWVWRSREEGSAGTAPAEDREAASRARARV
jgi:nucleoside-diphosphate-sugar epimerase/glycosyltransferase involved in cell wall biosynthesis